MREICLLVSSLLVFGNLLIGQSNDQRGFIPRATHTSRKALLIGNQSYRFSPLINPANDARDLGKSLQQMGFSTEVLTDSSKSQILSAARTFAASLASGDVGIFYYSGHGFQVDSDNYLVPIDFTASTKADALAQGVRFRDVQKALEQTGAGLIIMILDSCRNNPFEKTVQRKGLALDEAGLGSYLAFAASPGKTASDNPNGKNGLFTKYLLVELQQHISVAELFRRVRADVFEESSQTQLPYIHDQMIADVSLNPAQELQPAPTNPAGPQSGVAQSDLNKRFEEGKRLYHLGQCEQASGIFKQLAREDPENSFVQNALGLSYVCLHMNSPAAQSFGMAIRLKPDLAAAYINRGQVYLDSAQFELAVEDFTWAVEQEPENSAFHSRRGRALFSMRRYEDAMRDFSQAITLDPSNAYAYQGRGNVQHQLGKYGEALADYDLAIQLKGNEAQFYTDRALTRERSADQAGANADRAMVNRLKPRS